jgi:hypothetical protein
MSEQLVTSGVREQTESGGTSKPSSKKSKFASFLSYMEARPII